MKKKLALFIYSLASGGAERVISILLEELKEEFDTTLILMNNTIKYKIPINQKIIYLENSIPTESGLKKLFKLPFLALRYKRICKKHEIDISLSFMNRPNYINVLSSLFSNKIKILISERATPSLQHKMGIQGLVNRVLINFLYPMADKIIANSHGNAEDLISNFLKNKDRISVIYNPLDLESINVSANEECNIDFKRYTFTSVGRLDKGKNHRLLIEAFSQIDDANTQLFLIGEGALRDDLLKQIELLHLEDRVYLLGEQINPYKFLIKSDCFVFSSSFEGFPNVLLEALACGLPIVSTQCQSGPKEILGKNEFGILVPVDDVQSMKDAMELMLNNKDLSNQYQNRAKMRAYDFKKEHIMKKYIKVINE